MSKWSVVKSREIPVCNSDDCIVVADTLANSETGKSFEVFSVRINTVAGVQTVRLDRMKDGILIGLALALADDE